MLFTSCPFAFLPLNVEVRVFPSLETTDVTVITTWPSFFMMDWMVLESIRFNATVSALMNLRRASSGSESGNQLDSMVVVTIDIQTLAKPANRSSWR